MSATAPQERLAKTTSWLAQLKVNGEWAGFTAEHAAQKAQERYGKPLHELTVTEAQTLAWEYSDISKQKAEAARAALTPQSGPHSHPCFQCNGPVTCNRPDCRETVSEHRHCHEGYTSGEWANYHRRNGDGWWEPMVVIAILAGPIIGAIGDLFDKPGRPYQHIGSMVSNLGVFILAGAPLGITVMFFIEWLFQIKLSNSPLGIVMVILMGVAGVAYARWVPS